MFRMPALFFVFLFTLQAAGQRVIRGQVITTSGQPVSNCNVFVNNSTRGTVTDATGHFELADPPVGKHELVISSVGYDTYVVAYGEDQWPLTINAELKIKVKELDNVVLEPYAEGTWAQWGAKFLDNFIGTSANSFKCRIRNTDSIHFRFYRKSNRLVAYADVPLQIDNEALGYHISYQLEAFELNFNTGSLFYAGYPQMSELEAPRKGVESRWSRQRQKAYQGSVLHFMRSLYDDRLTQEGFEVHFMKKVPNLEKERVKKIVIKDFIMPDGRKTVMDISGKGQFPKDSQTYYQNVLRQPDQQDIYGPAISRSDSLLENSDTKDRILFFPDYLYVIYKNETEEEAFLKSQYPPRRPSWQRSWIGLLNGNAIGIEPTGNYYDSRDILTMGYWGFIEKIADYMPVDYEPAVTPEKK